MGKSRTGIHIEGDAADFLQELTKVIQKTKEHERGLKKLTGETNKLTKEEKELARAAKRVYDDTRTPQERHITKMRQLNQLVSKGKIDQDTYRRAVNQSQQALTRAGQAGTEAFGPRALGMLRNVAGALGVGGGIAGAIALINQGHQKWLQNISEVAAAANKASRDYIAFAALQEGGKKAERVQKAAALGARYGVSDLGLSWDTIQAMQSATGKYAKGEQISKTIFAATQTGMKLEDAREIATLAVGLGLDPEVALRRAHVAGEASMRSPKELATAGPALKYWQDREVGWAAAAVLAGQVPAAKLETYTKRGGMGLMQVPGQTQKAFEAIGLGKAGQLERLRELHRRGIDTVEEVTRFGFTEIREAEAVAGLVKQFPALERITGEIHRQAKPGLFGVERAAVERELPGAKLERFGELITAEHVREIALGRGATAAQRKVNEQRLRALAIRRLHGKTAGPFDLMEEKEEGDWRSTTWDVAQAEMMLALRGKDIRTEMMWLRANIESGLGVPEPRFRELPRARREAVYDEGVQTRALERWIEVAEQMSQAAARLDQATRQRPVQVTE